MKREELPNETPRKDMMREALKHYEELAAIACWHRSDIPEAIRAYYAPLPPAEGAEEILVKHGFFIMAHKDSNEEVRKAFIEPVLAAMQEFATLHAQKIADKMVEERLREELIDFLSYCKASNVATFGKYIIDKYLKSREK